MLRPRLSETLKEGGRAIERRSASDASVFVVVEMAMALVLLVGAGLMVRSLAALLGELIPLRSAQRALVRNFSDFRSLRDAGPVAFENTAKVLRQFESVPGVESVAMIGGFAPHDRGF